MADFKYITEQRAYDDVVAANRRFRRRELPGRAYGFWEAHGVDPQTWVLGSFALNDDGPCYHGNIIDPEGAPFYFQVDFSDPDNCMWERVDVLPKDTRHAIHMALVLRDELRAR